MLFSVVDYFKIDMTVDRVAQLVTCLTADPGVASSIPARSHTFMEIDHEIISMAILLPSADSRRVFVSYKRKYAPEKGWLGELTVQRDYSC